MNYLCMDVGGSAIKYALVNEQAEILTQGSFVTPESKDLMYQGIKECFDRFDNVSGLALSMPGAVDSETGIIGGSSAIDYIHGPCIKEDLQALLDARVEMENDANCAALAEVWLGASKDVEDCCFIVSGSGIGGAVVKERRIHKGKHLHGGEFGYMIASLDYASKEMKTWSEVGSTLAVVNEVAKELGVDPKSLNGKDIFDHAYDNEVYYRAVDRYYMAMAYGIYNLQYAFDPEKIVIGGAISMRDDLVDEINKRLDIIFEKFTHAHIRPVVCTCHYHNDANLLGALYHFLTINS